MVSEALPSSHLLDWVIRRGETEDLRICLCCVMQGTWEGGVRGWVGGTAEGQRDSEVAIGLEQRYISCAQTHEPT